MNSFDLKSIIQNELDNNIKKGENSVIKDVEMNEHMEGQIESIESTLKEQGRMLVNKIIIRLLTDHEKDANAFIVPF